MRHAAERKLSSILHNHKERPLYDRGFLLNRATESNVKDKLMIIIRVHNIMFLLGTRIENNTILNCISVPISR